MDTTSQPSHQNAPLCDLASFDGGSYRPGRNLLVCTLWYFCSLLLFESGWFPVRKVKVGILRMFGAKVGTGVVLKPHLRIKYPWRLKIGDHCWIGQGVWIDNIEDVIIDDHVCISQLVYLCTGSHDHTKRTFDLIAKPIVVRTGAWVAARSLLLGGVEIGNNALVAAGSVVNKDVPARACVGGVPARVICYR